MSKYVLLLSTTTITNASPLLDSKIEELQPAYHLHTENTFVLPVKITL